MPGGDAKLPKALWMGFKVRLYPLSRDIDVGCPDAVGTEPMLR
jgi:hypothetical protein